MYLVSILLLVIALKMVLLLYLPLIL